MPHLACVCRDGRPSACHAWQLRPNPRHAYTLPPSSSALQFVAHYTSAAAGPGKWPKLVEWLASTWPRITAELVTRQQGQVRPG
jgi:hypothetical protein